MSTSITLKNIPEPLYRRIRMAADRHHRSLNSEIIARLEQALAPHPVDVEESAATGTSPARALHGAAADAR